MTRGPEASAVPATLPLETGWPDDPQPRLGHNTLRLQPVVLGPPPDPSYRDVSADDDLDLGSPKPRPGILVGAMALVLVLLTAGAAYFWLRSEDGSMAALPPAPTAVSLPPAQQVPAEASPTLPVPPIQSVVMVPPAAEPPAALAGPAIQVAQPPSENPEMGGVQTELVPPATDGLSPARRVQTIRIVVENDRELAAPR